MSTWCRNNHCWKLNITCCGAIRIWQGQFICCTLLLMLPLSFFFSSLFSSFSPQPSPHWPTPHTHWRREGDQGGSRDLPTTLKNSFGDVINLCPLKPTSTLISHSLLGPHWFTPTFTQISQSLSHPFSLFSSQACIKSQFDDDTASLSTLQRHLSPSFSSLISTIEKPSPWSRIPDPSLFLTLFSKP